MTFKIQDIRRSGFLDGLPEVPTYCKAGFLSAVGRQGFKSFKNNHIRELTNSVIDNTKKYTNIKPIFSHTIH